MSTTFDQIVHRLQSIEPFLIQKINPAGFPEPWAQVSGPAVVAELVINPHTLREQVDAIAAQIAHWGRLVAQTKRVWEVHERLYRHWRSTQELALMEKLTEVEVDAKGKSKTSKPSQATIESHYRTDPLYATFSARIEEAEEAYNSTVAIHEAFKAKAAILRTDLYRVNDGSIQRWSP